MKTFAFETWGSPEEAGVSSAGILRFLDEWEKVRKTIQLHSLVMLRHGKIVWKMNVAPYSDRTVHTMYSLSKSFTSAAATSSWVESGLEPVTYIWAPPAANVRHR